MSGGADTGKENAMTLSKVIASTLVASLGVPVAAMAAQQFGRDSVYAAPGITVRAAAVAAVGTHPGRDSVYATLRVGRTYGHSTASQTLLRYGRV
jgi:hypothetical protein